MPPPAFEATVVRAIDGDSVVVLRADTQKEERIRVGGVDVPSRGRDADAGKRIVESWKGHVPHTLADDLPNCFEKSAPELRCAATDGEIFIQG